MAEKKPTITLDGREVEFTPGQTVMQVAASVGQDIPHYCYHPALSIAGNCRMCQVEIEGWDKPQISCKLQASDGQVVSTKSELARSAQAGTMEMLLVNHPLDCPICDQAGECHLQDYSYEVGQGKASARTEKTKARKNVPFGAKVVYDAERCIKCTQCVRFCEEITQTHELAMGGRSDTEEVIMTSKGEFTTPYAMNIIDICPVGALTSRDFRFKSRLWFMDFKPTVCTGCARGCNVTSGGRNGEFLRMTPRENQDVNRWWMCDAGRLDYKYANSETRLAAPQIKGADGSFAEANWEDAIAAAATALQASSGGALLDGGCTLEEMHLAQAITASIGGDTRFAAPTGDDGDDFLIVNEKGANAKGAGLLGIERAGADAKAALLMVERDGHVPAALRAASGAVVVFATDAAHVPDSATVVFPLGCSAERDGLLVNTDGRVQALNRNAAIGPNNLASSIELLEEVLGELDSNYAWRGRDGVLRTLKALPAFTEVEFPVAFATADVGAAS